MGRTTLVEHAIDTGNHRPIREGLRRYPIAHLAVIDKQVNEMMRNDIVEPAASPWASNVVLVGKKDGSHVDYRALSSVTHYDTYPLPHIDTGLGSMDSAIWFSVLDLRYGYHNIPIREPLYLKQPEGVVLGIKYYHLVVQPHHQLFSG